MSRHITKTEYDAAKLLVADYEKNEQAKLEALLPKVEQDLKEYFAKNKVCDRKVTIKAFFLRIETSFVGTKQLVIHPTRPQFDEDYYETDEEEAEIKVIGQKHGFTDCGIGSEYFGK